MWQKPSLILIFLKNYENDYRIPLDFMKTPGKKNLSRESQSGRNIFHYPVRSLFNLKNFFTRRV